MLKFIEFNGIEGYARVMYNDVKDADKYRIDVTYNGRDVKDLLEYLFKLEQQLEQKDNIINEVSEYMALNIRVKLNEEFGETMQYKTIYEILDKGVINNDNYRTIN